MRVFSQINNCQQKESKKTKKKQQKTDKTKRGAPLLGLAKLIYYLYSVFIRCQAWWDEETGRNCTGVLDG